MVLVAAAWEPELEPFRALLPPHLTSSIQGLAVGIGPVDAAVGTARALALYAPVVRLVLVGTCGASPGAGLSIGDVVVGTSVRLVDPATVEGRAAIPYSAEIDLAAPDLAGARPATIANTLGITTDDALARTLAPSGEVEHLEAYGVARACRLASVSCTVILGVANVVGASGRAEWRANHVAASAGAAEVAWSFLRTSTTARWPG